MEGLLSTGPTSSSFILLSYLKCSMKVRKFLLHEFATQRAKKSFFKLFLHICIREKKLCLYILGLLSTCFCDRSFFFWQKCLWVAKKLCVTEVFFLRKLGKNFFSLMKTRLVTLTFFVKETCLCQVKLLCYITFFLWQNLVLSKIPFFGDFIGDFMGKVFCEK